MFSALEAAVICKNNNQGYSSGSSIYCWGKNTLPDCNMKKPQVFYEASPKRPSCCALFSSEALKPQNVNPAYCAAAALKSTLKKYEEFLVPPRQVLTEAAKSIREHTPRADVSFAVLYITCTEVYFCCSGNCQGFRLRDNEMICLNRKSSSNFVYDSLPDNTRLKIMKGDLQHGDTFLIFTENYDHAASNMQLYNLMKYGGTNLEKVEHILHISKRNADNTGGIILIST